MKKRENWEISAFGWNGISGVYCICSIENNKNKIHYIGSSYDIGKRLTNKNHPYRKLYKTNRFIYIKFKETKEYLQLEFNLIKRLKPELNKRGK